MTPAERKETEARLTLEEQDRMVFRRVFRTGEGVQVLTWILNECGHWAGDPAQVVPELHALGNRLLGKMGAVHEMNLFELAGKCLEAANDTDIAALRAMLQKEDEE